MQRGVDQPAGHVARSTRRQFPSRDLGDVGVAEPGVAQRVEQQRQAGDVAERRGHRRAVEVGAEADRVDARDLGDVGRVRGDRRERRVGVLGAVRAQEADVEVDPDQAAALADRAQLVVGEVARRRAERVGAGVRRDERRRAQLGDVPEPARVEVGEVDEDPQRRRRPARARARRPRGPAPGRASPGSRTARRSRTRSAGSRPGRASACPPRAAPRARRAPARSARRPRGAGRRRAPLAVEVARRRAHDAQAARPTRARAAAASATCASASASACRCSTGAK